MADSSSRLSHTLFTDTVGKNIVTQRVSTVSSKGQITSLSIFDGVLGVEARDKVAFVLDDATVRLVRLGDSVVRRTTGALRSSKSARSAEELRAAAEDAVAADAEAVAGS
jgi:bifunctional DNA-binding transcriptional regulator/antitoxin component of YhaV-PrlF toxin-antitoxin module